MTLIVLIVCSVANGLSVSGASRCYDSPSSIPTKFSKRKMGGPLSLVNRRSTRLSASVSGSDHNNSNTVSSKRKMLGFAIPALGIFLMNPLLSNIDNMFVGQVTGTIGLAALSPATICTDQMLYLCSFLARATTGIVSASDDDTKQEAACTPLAASICVGLFLSLIYSLFTPSMLNALKVRPELQPMAKSYIYIRGAIASAALLQSSCLSVLLASKDALTPLKIVAMAAMFNVCGDYLLCVKPFRLGCAGASAATAGATLLSSFLLIRTLIHKRLLVTPILPNFFRTAFTSGKKKWLELVTYAGPLLAITITRLSGFLVMQRTAMSLGVTQLAGYQLCINLLLFFLLFGEPLSQLSQTNLPSLLFPSNNTKAAKSDQTTDLRKTLKSIITLASGASIGVATVAFLMARFGSGFFSSDAAVLAITHQTAPAIFFAVATAIFTVALDGAMLASREFGFMFSCGISTFIMQLFMLPRAKSLTDIFATFTWRLGLYSVAILLRTNLFKRGLLGRALKEEKMAKTA